MQISILSVITLAAAVMAVPNKGFYKRQTAELDVSKPAMTNANGDVLAFNAEEVYLPSSQGKVTKRTTKKQ